jgi:hypothetical protein
MDPGVSAAHLNMESMSEPAMAAKSEHASMDAMTHHDRAMEKSGDMHKSRQDVGDNMGFYRPPQVNLELTYIFLPP